MAIELGVAYISVVPSAKGLQANLARELAPVSGIAAAEGTKAGKSLGGNISKGLNSSIGKLSGLAAGLGVPFAAQLSTINSRFDLSTAKAENFGKTLSNIGRTELIAAGVGIVAVGTSAVHAADQFEIAHARLETSVRNTGRSFEAASPGVSALDDKFVKLGFNTSDTENALSRLTAATHNVGKAIELMGLAADIARARNIPLVQATDLLAKASLGTYTGLRRLGIVSKEDVASFHSLADVTEFLTDKFGGQGAAFAETFAGKMQALKAQANQLEVTLGTALIPKIEALASGTIGAVQGFEHINAATGGWLGKIVLAGSAVPIAVFAIEKLNAVGAAVAGQYAKLGTVFGATTVQAEAATVANEELAASEAAVGAAGAKVAPATAAFGGLGLAVAAAAAAVLAYQHNSSTGNNPLQTPGFLRGVVNRIPGGNPFDSRGGKDLGDSEAAKFAQTLTVTQASADKMGLKLKELQAATSAYAIATAQGRSGVVAYNETLNRLGVTTHENIDAQTSYQVSLRETIAKLSPSEKASFALAASQKQYADDLANAHTPAAQLDADKRNLAAASKNEAEIQTKVNDATNAGATAANAGRFAYLGLADSVKTAADALTQISQHAFIKFDAEIRVHQDQTSVQSALDALNNPDTGGGGGNSGPTPAAAFLDQQQKEIALRDARRGQEQAIQGVTDAQNALTQAQRDQVTAANTLRSAQENYRTTLQGVAKDSKAAKDATDQLTQAKNNQAGSQLSVRDAERNLKQAKNDKELLALDVKAAKKKLEDDRKGTAGTTTFVQTPTGSQKVTQGGTGPADADTIRRDQIALNDAIIAQSGADDTVKKAELQLSDAKLAAKQKTKDLAEAQRVYNGTLNGFPPSSHEAKAAQDQLTQAQQGAKTAADQVRQAQETLTTAMFQTRDAALALYRATADLNGLLTKSSGASAAGKKLDSLRTRVDNASNAIKQLAIDAADADLKAGHSIGHSILVEIQTLEAYAAANPLLAHAFDSALKELENKFLADLIKRESPTGLGGGVHVPGGPNRYAEGGSTGSGDPDGMFAIVHPNEFVIRQQSVAKYGLHMMESLNAGRLPMLKLGGTTSPTKNARVWSGGDTYEVNIHGDIYGMNDFDKKVIEGLRRHTDRQGFVSGVRTAG